MPSTYYVAWWNLENLFDEENSPRRTEKLQRTIGADLAGWTPARRDRKVAQLASVIAQMNGGAGPDLLGVCEVENRFVLELLVATLATPLPGRNYDIVHADTEDARGIDVAFLYDAGLFTAPADQVFFHAVSTRQRQRVVEADTPRFWNLSWEVIGDPPDGTFYFNDEPNLLDQFLVNKNMARQNTPLRAKAETVEILRFPGTFSTGKYPRPKPFGGMGKAVDEDGFSDHFPIGMQVTEAD